MSAREYDVVVLGGGMGGYVAAIRASQLGLKTAVVEAAKLGGTCLHVGCIPTKALLESSGLFHKAGRAEFGVTADRLGFDFGRIATRRDKVVDQLFRGVQGLMRKNRIDVVEGRGRLSDPRTVQVDGHSLKARRGVIVGTGSRPRGLPGVDFDGERVINSDHATLAGGLPKSVVIVGAGAIGVEFATLYHQLGVPVSLVEALDRLVPLEDPDVSNEVAKQFKAAGIRFRTSARVKAVEETKDGVHVAFEDGEPIEAEKLLVAIGREPLSEDIGLGAAGVKIGKGGFVAAEDIAGKRATPMEQDLVTRTTYSQPQIASVGLTEPQARERGHEVTVGKFPFLANGRALIHGEPGGFAKLVVDAKSGQLLGAHIVGVEATELIAEPALARLFQGDAWEVGRNIHPHPTLSEVIGEAALAVDGAAIHI